MLNIETRISLSKTSKRKVKLLWKDNDGHMNGGSWGSIHHTVKNELSEKLFVNQNFRCAYCERYLTGLAPQIDHFAHKASYARFTFNPVNLFYACSFCNSNSIKGQKNTIANYNDRYDLCRHNIVHPYKDNPDDEISYQDDDKIYLDVAGSTFLGKRTIVFFKYHKTIMSNIRSKQLVFERLNPLLPQEEEELIQESIAYRR